MFSPQSVYQYNESFGGWLDSVKSGLAAVVPGHTIVGKWAKGDTAGAAADATKALTGGGKAGTGLRTNPMDPSFVQPKEDDTGTILMYVALAGLGLGAFMLLRKRK
jgi:hypothetical protein